MSEKKNNLPWENPRFNNWVVTVRVYQLARKQLSSALSELDLDLPSYDVLAAAYRFPGLTHSELASKILVGRSNLSMLLPDMEASGLLVRKTDPNDKRRRRVFLSDEGRLLAEKGLQIQNALIDHMMDPVSAEQCDAMADTMRSVGLFLEENPFK